MSNWNTKDGSVWQQDDGSGDISPENLPDYCEWLENRVAYLEAMVVRLIEAIGGYFFGVEHPASIWRKKISDLVAEWNERDE